MSQNIPSFFAHESGKMTDIAEVTNLWYYDFVRKSILSRRRIPGVGLSQTPFLAPKHVLC